MSERIPNILIAVSDSNIRRAVAQTIANKFANVDVAEARDSDEMLNRSLAPPDLFIIAVELDQTDCVHWIHRIRRNPRTRAVPVLILADQDDPRVDTRVTHLTDSAVIHLPLKVDELLLHVEVLLRRRYSGALEANPREAIRRDIRATLDVGGKIVACGPEGVFVTAEGEAPAGAWIECNFANLYTLLGLPPVDAFVARQTGGVSVHHRQRTALIEPTDEEDALRETLKSARLPDGSIPFFLRAETVELSASGLLFRCPWGFTVGGYLSLSLAALGGAVGSKTDETQVVGRVVRVAPKGEWFECAVQFQQASPELIADILYWTTQT